MLLKGLQKLTLLDFPGKMAATVFTGGCNLRCPFCHNASLVTEIDESNLWEEEEIVEKIFAEMNKNEEILKNCDTENVEEMVHVMPMTNVLREDVRKQNFSRESLLEGAPERNDDSWQVPRLVK